MVTNFFGPIVSELRPFWNKPIYSRITSGQPKRDNNNRMIQLTHVFCVLLRYNGTSITWLQYSSDSIIRDPVTFVPIPDTLTHQLTAVLLWLCLEPMNNAGLNDMSTKALGMPDNHYSRPKILKIISWPNVGRFVDFISILRTNFLYERHLFRQLFLRSCN